VQLHYTEHPGVPTSCFADTRYFVDNVSITDNEPGTPGTALPDAPPRPYIPESKGPGSPTPAPAPPGASPPSPVPIPSNPASAAH